MASCLKLNLATVPLDHRQPKPNLKIKTQEPISDHYTLSLLEQCHSMRQLKQFHAHMLRIGLFFHPYSASRLLTFCALSRNGSLEYALQVFDQIPQPNLYMWNTIIRGHASSNNPTKSLHLFSHMLQDSIDPPNKFTFPFVIKAISELSALQEGKGIHGMVVKTGFGSDVFVVNSLIHFYAACGFLSYAHQVFVKSPQKDVVSWNSMITGYAQSDCPEEALELFGEMETMNVKPNDVTMVGVLSACAKKGDLKSGRWFHSYIERNSISSSLILNNSILDMYTKCGSVDDARRVFDEMPERDSVSWTTMVVGYAKSGEFESARCVFDQMPTRDIASWNALISSYEQSDQPKKALALFHELQLTKVKPDQVTLVSALSACSQLGAMDLGRWIHAYMSKQSFGLNFHLTTALIDMYTKCGDLEKALEVFQSVEKKDVFVWSAMIAGLAMHGHGESAIDLFLKMQEAKVKPNVVTFTNVLCACSHTGLVDEGKRYFDQMSHVYGIEPKIEQYGCMVDILGRAGRLEEAMDFIERMPISPKASVWGALLGACSNHGNVELGERACSKLLELEPENDGAYVLLSNIYAKAGHWDSVTRVRKTMKDRGLKKEPGCSLIEVDGVVHEFLVGDISHPLSVKIYSKLDEISLALKSKGYVPNMSQLLQDIEEEDVKEHALYLHSEKLAIAFGLITTASQATIRIVKNLRICGDCHEAAKLISSVYDREILLRDRYRFHHFKAGSCSCKGYW